jgi:hypothetical protein
MPLLPQAQAATPDHSLSAAALMRAGLFARPLLLLVLLVLSGTGCRQKAAVGRVIEEDGPVIVRRGAQAFQEWWGTPSPTAFRKKFREELGKPTVAVGVASAAQRAHCLGLRKELSGRSVSAAEYGDLLIAETFGLAIPRPPQLELRDMAEALERIGRDLYGQFESDPTAYRNYMRSVCRAPE